MTWAVVEIFKFAKNLSQLLKFTNLYTNFHLYLVPLWREAAIVLMRLLLIEILLELLELVVFLGEGSSRSGWIAVISLSRFFKILILSFIDLISFLVALINCRL
jgi:hypothetical protein